MGILIFGAELFILQMVFTHKVVKIKGGFAVIGVPVRFNRLPLRKLTQIAKNETSLFNNMPANYTTATPPASLPRAAAGRH